MFPPATLTEMAQRSALSVCVDGEPCGGMGAVGGRPGVSGKTVERVCRTLGSGCQGDARRRPVICQSFLWPQSTHRSSPAVTASVARISLAPRQSVVLFLTQSKKKMILKQKKRSARIRKRTWQLVMSSFQGSTSPRAMPLAAGRVRATRREPRIAPATA